MDLNMLRYFNPELISPHSTTVKFKKVYLQREEEENNDDIDADGEDNDA